MADTVAPAAAPPAPAPAPASAAAEVVINPSPTNIPTPVGPQAPDKPPEAPKQPAAHRRESIQKAFDRAKTATKDADTPKAGHNQPPEETPKEPPQGRQPPHREQGRFARAPQAGDPAQAGNAGVVPGVPGQPGQPQRGAPRVLPDTAPYRDPPPRMAEHARAEWASAPESVRGEVYRMAQEAEGMHKHYRADQEVMNSIRHFHQMAQEHGTTLDRALTNYVGMETKLRSDLVGGLDVIVQNLGLRTADGQPIGLRDVAYHILNQSPEQHRITQTTNATAAANHQIGALHQELAGLKNAISQMHTQQQFTYTRSAVDQFADTHPRFDELAVPIERELQLGFDLETAYRRAELLHPAPPAAQTRDPSAQTRPDKSIYGAPESDPSNGSKPRRGDKPVERRDAIQSAMRRVGGGFA